MLPKWRVAMSEFVHEPVMFDEVMAVFSPIVSGVIIDGTLGGGGHSDGLLSLAENRFVLGIDRDIEALAAAENRLAKFGNRFISVHSAFDEISNVLTIACNRNKNFCVPPSGLLLDLGVSSPQLDRGERGFSFRSGGPLDMRMDASSGLTLAQLLENSTVDEIARVLRENGESRFARRISKAILENQPYASTTELAQVVKDSIPAAARRTGGHPATRVFQALRIMVNGELEGLKSALEEAFELILPGGRIAVLSYHSGEDAIVKNMFREQVQGNCRCPVNLPCVCGAQPRAKYVVRSKGPSDFEIENNPRSKSARLRAVEMLSSGQLESGDFRG